MWISSLGKNAVVSSGARNKNASIAIHATAKMRLRSQVVFFDLGDFMVLLLDIS